VVDTKFVYKERVCEVIHFDNKNQEDLNNTPIEILLEIKNFEDLCKQK